MASQKTPTPFEDYQTQYQKRFELFKLESPDAIELDFIEDELEGYTEATHLYENQESIKIAAEVDFWEVRIPSKSEYTTAKRIKDFLIQKQVELEKKTKQPDESYEFFLNEDGIEKLSWLLRNYKDAKPQKIALMVLALGKLNFLKTGALKNISRLHRALENTFGKIGSRQILSDNLSNLTDDYHIDLISTHKAKILKG